MPGHHGKSGKSMGVSQGGSHGDRRDNYKAGGSSAFSRPTPKRVSNNRRANEFSGTGKTVDTSKFRDQRRRKNNFNKLLLWQLKT